MKRGVIETILATGLLVIPYAASAASLFTHPPTDIRNVAGVVPLGNLSPSSRHILPVDHMYLKYPHPNSNGAYAYSVSAMAEGRIVMVIRQKEPPVPANYQIYIRHNGHVTSYVSYIYELSDRVGTHLESTGAGWKDIGDPSFQFMILGRFGAPGPLTVAGGEALGRTRSYHEYWDIGVIDSLVTGSFLGKGPRRYPTVKDLLALFGYPNVPNPYPGQQSRNAVSFIKYMTPALRSAWFNLLMSTPKDHGRVGWDLDGRLRGAWFNPKVDTAPVPPLMELDSAAISVIPFNLAPNAKVQIAVGQGHSLAALDPTMKYPQLGKAVTVNMDLTAGARVNPDPATVGIKTGTVCYDVAYDDNGTPRFNCLLFRMVGTRRVAIRFDPTPHDACDCVNRLADQPDETWVYYRR